MMRSNFSTGALLLFCSLRSILDAYAFISPSRSFALSSVYGVSVSPSGASVSTPSTSTVFKESSSTASADQERARDEELLHRALLAARLCGAGHAESAVASGGGGGGVKGKKKSSRSGSSARKPKRNKGNDSTAYVGNLPYDATESQVRELFEAYGTVTRIYMPTDRDTGSFRGFAFVSMSNRDEMLRATKALDQSSFLGRIIYSNESLPKDQQKREMSETKLYVGNLSFQTSKDDLHDFFGQYGTVRDVYIPLDRETGTPRGFAFVKMGKEDCENVLEGANGQVLDGRTLSVSLSLPRGQKAPKSEKRRSIKLYVGNLSFATDVEAVRSVFQEYGKVLDCYMPLDRETGNSRGFAFVTMESDAAMRAADETDGYEWNGRILRVNEAQPKGVGESGPVSYGYDDGATDGDSWGDDSGDGSWGGEAH